MSNSGKSQTRSQRNMRSIDHLLTHRAPRTLGRVFARGQGINRNASTAWVTAFVYGILSTVDSKILEEVLNELDRESS